MNITLVALSEITPYHNNPRKNTAAVKYVAASIKEFGFNQPIVVDSNLVIIAGHTRYEAAKMLQLQSVPIVVAKHLTPEEVRAYRIADNRTNENAKWDDAKLKYELEALQDVGYDLVHTAFTDIELERLLKSIEQAETVGETKEYASKFEVVVTCHDEVDQQTVYELLASKGYQCRVLSM